MKRKFALPHIIMTILLKYMILIYLTHDFNHVLRLDISLYIIAFGGTGEGIIRTYYDKQEIA